MVRLKSLGMILCLSLGFAGPASAGEGLQTLRRIAETGIIRIGYGQASAPFSYDGEDGRPIGYAIDLCRRVVDALRTDLALPDLRIEYVKRTASDRVRLLNEGAMDLECASSTNTEARRRSVWFSYSHYLTCTRFVALASSGIRQISDLAGRSVAVTKGTINIAQLNAASREHGLQVALLQNDSLDVAFTSVSEGKASAFVMDGILLATMIANSGHPQDYTLSSECLAAPEPYGLMMRHGDSAFRDAVDGALARIYASGEIERIYDRWFNAPIPPHGVNLGVPMSEELRNIFSDPKALTPFDPEP